MEDDEGGGADAHGGRVDAKSLLEVRIFVFYLGGGEYDQALSADLFKVCAIIKKCCILLSCYQQTVFSPN